MVKQWPSQEMDLLSQVQTLDEAVGISFHLDIFEKGMNTSLLSPIFG